MKGKKEDTQREKERECVGVGVNVGVCLEETEQVFSGQLNNSASLGTLSPKTKSTSAIPFSNQTLLQGKQYLGPKKLEAFKIE